MGAVYDEKVPARLRTVQEWFASVITAPLTEEGLTAEVTLKGVAVAEEAEHYIRPNSKLQPHQRVGLYNQQYWWRLVNILQQEYPFLLRIFGYHEFNHRLVVPYLKKYGSTHWDLNLLGKKLPEWIQSEYRQSDRRLVYDVAQIDRAFQEVFVGHWEKPVDLLDTVDVALEQIAEWRLGLQSALRLFELPSDLFTARRRFLSEEVEYWSSHPFPEVVKGRCYFVLWRNEGNEVVWRELSRGEWQLLSAFQKGMTLEAACDQLDLTEVEMVEVEQGIQRWIQEWTMKGWLVCR